MKSRPEFVRWMAFSAQLFTECITMVLFFVVAYFILFYFMFLSNLGVTHFKVWPPINCYSVQKIFILSRLRLYPKKKC